MALHSLGEQYCTSMSSFFCPIPLLVLPTAHYHRHIHASIHYTYLSLFHQYKKHLFLSSKCQLLCLQFVQVIFHQNNKEINFQHEGLVQYCDKMYCRYLVKQEDNDSVYVLRRGMFQGCDWPGTVLHITKHSPADAFNNQWTGTYVTCYTRTILHP